MLVSWNCTAPCDGCNAPMWSCYQDGETWTAACEDLMG
jgi:hypothetical protein